jgi:hypothetical protein
LALERTCLVIALFSEANLIGQHDAGMNDFLKKYFILIRGDSPSFILPAPQ